MRTRPGAMIALLGSAVVALASDGCGRGLEPAAATGGSAGAGGTGAAEGAGGPLALATPMVVFTVPGRAPVRVAVEIADTPASRKKGLMDRTSLPAAGGMLFVFERESVQAFWMKDTYIALDMIFVDGMKRVVGVLRDVPPLTESSRSVGKPARFVVEVNAGFAAREGIVEGASVELVGVPGL